MCAQPTQKENTGVLYNSFVNMSLFINYNAFLLYICHMAPIHFC